MTYAFCPCPRAPAWRMKRRGWSAIVFRRQGGPHNAQLDHGWLAEFDGRPTGIRGGAVFHISSTSSGVRTYASFTRSLICRSSSSASAAFLRTGGWRSSGLLSVTIPCTDNAETDCIQGTHPGYSGLGRAATQATTEFPSWRNGG